jgi:hypothetical protein
MGHLLATLMVKQMALQMGTPMDLRMVQQMEILMV